jgi:hypothetical protein
LINQEESTDDEWLEPPRKKRPDYPDILAIDEVDIQLRGDFPATGQFERALYTEANQVLFAVMAVLDTWRHVHFPVANGIRKGDGEYPNIGITGCVLCHGADTEVSADVASIFHTEGWCVFASAPVRDASKYTGNVFVFVRTMSMRSFFCQRIFSSDRNCSYK